MDNQLIIKEQKGWSHIFILPLYLNFGSNAALKDVYLHLFDPTFVS